MLKKLTSITSLLFGVMAILAVSFFVFEWIQLNQSIDEDTIQKEADLATNQAYSNFSEYVFNFTTSTADFVDDIKSNISTGNELNAESFSLENYGFWGFTVFRANETLFWDGFSTTDAEFYALSSLSDIQVNLQRQGNVRYIESLIPFQLDGTTDTTMYHALTRTRIQQINSSDIGTESQLVASEFFKGTSDFPVQFSFSSLNNDSLLTARTFTSISGDELATIYTTRNDIPAFIEAKNNQITRIRSFFVGSFVFTFLLLLIWTSRKAHPYTRFAVHLLSALAIYWLLSTQLITKVFSDLPFFGEYNLYWFALLIPLVLAYLALHLVIKTRLGDSELNDQREHFILSFLHGLSVAACLTFTFDLASDVLSSTQVNLFNQTLTSSFSTTFWLFCMGGASSLILTVSNRSMYRIWKVHSDVPWSWLAFSVAGSVLVFFITWIFSSAFTLDAWTPILVILLCLGIHSITFIQWKFKVKKYRSSLLRLYLLINLIAATGFTAVLYLSYQQSLQLRLHSEAQNFVIDNEDRIQAVTTSLLMRAHQQVPTISLYNVSNFEQIVSQIIEDEWLKYSFSVQLIDKNGSPLAEYNTNLSAPQWSTNFRVEELIIPYEDERIRRENLRPVLRDKPINTVNAQYSFFSRGWVPVYRNANSEDITGWILASVYREIPEINRPFRSFVNATIKSFDETAFSLTEFNDGKPVRSSVVGTLNSVPDYGILPQSVVNKLKSDSGYSERNTIQTVNVNELFMETDKGRVIRAAYRNISNTQLLYTFLRIYFTITIPFICWMLCVLGYQLFAQKTETRRIRDRLLDRLIMASLLCLILLVAVTYEVLEQQNKLQMQEELRTKLKTLVSSVETANEDDIFSETYLENLTDVIGIDATLFMDGSLINSTTPQIYSKHLVSEIIPWNVYSSIVYGGFEQEINVIELDDLELMIGYQPWLDQNQQIVGIAAIPTFLKTPRFYEQLLTTTSYLLALYTLIFGILIVIIGIISARITAPLEELERGLEKISQGDLNTRLPVSAVDEIGLLTKAYNTMVTKLKTLQEELADRERQAAWQQMAQQVAHEIKNPLTPMKLNLQHLERQLQQTGEELQENKPRVVAITKSMIEQIDALSKIASDFSKFARPSKQEFRDVKINQLIQSVSELYTEGDIKLITLLSSDELTISGIQEELRRVFVNLIKNAQEAIDEEGQVTIESHVTADKQRILVTITDTGKGIDSETAENIFMPNFSTKTSGTGLGLAITKKIVEEHKGAITFQSTLGQGTCFTLDFPLKSN